jgi:hypothetical protein
MDFSPVKEEQFGGHQYPYIFLRQNLKGQYFLGVFVGPSLLAPILTDKGESNKQSNLHLSTHHLFSVSKCDY